MRMSADKYIIYQNCSTQCSNYQLMENFKYIQKYKYIISIENKYECSWVSSTNQDCVVLTAIFK